MGRQFPENLSKCARWRPGQVAHSCIQDGVIAPKSDRLELGMNALNRIGYLLVVALLIFASLLSTLGGWRSFLSPVLLLQLGTLLNMLMKIGAGLLFAYLLILRFKSVFTRSIDISLKAKTRHARFLQRVSVAIMYSFFVIVPLYYLMLRYGGPIKAELRFMFLPLLKVLPFGYILFEISRIIDLDERVGAAASSQKSRL